MIGAGSRQRRLPTPSTTACQHWNLTREYEIADDLIDAASVDLIRKNALAARFTGPSGTRW
jgi:hypothetical protein